MSVRSALEWMVERGEQFENEGSGREQMYWRYTEMESLESHNSTN